MRGTAFGTVVLHVSFELVVGDPLILIPKDDLIELIVPMRTINEKISDAKLALRAPSSATLDALAKPTCGWEGIYFDHVQQAHLGADLDFSLGSSGSETPRESH
jgi:dihydroxyacid dehydratase/phosphogluconate dehydratase